MRLKSEGEQKMFQLRLETKNLRLRELLLCLHKDLHIPGSERLDQPDVMFARPTWARTLVLLLLGVVLGGERLRVDPRIVS